VDYPKPRLRALRRPQPWFRVSFKICDLLKLSYDGNFELKVCITINQKNHNRFIPVPTLSRGNFDLGRMDGWHLFCNNTAFMDEMNAWFSPVFIVAIVAWTFFFFSSTVLASSWRLPAPTR
jgi:hypothetical protein